MPTAIDTLAIAHARALRRNMTEGEKKLWSALKDMRRHHGIHVRKQVPIGPYAADFAIRAKGLVIEVDGEHHFQPEQMAREREEWFSTQGYRVIRFTTGDLHEAFEGCIEKVLAEVGVA